MRQLYKHWADSVLSSCHLLMYEDEDVIMADGNINDANKA